MKKRIKNDGSYKRFYASGMPMYRWRKQNFPVVAGTMVNVIKVKTATAICEVKTTKEQKAELEVDNIILSIPLDNFQGDALKVEKSVKTGKPAKKSKGKKAPVVAAEPEAAAVPVVAVEAVTPTMEAAPVVPQQAEPAVV